MTINIQDLREKIARATPAPWEVIFEPRKHIVIGSRAGHTGVCVIFNDAHDLEYKQDNAALIVAAVNNVAALCDEVERLREALEVYADKSNWLDTDDEFLSSFCTDDFDWGWQAARKALGKDE